MHHDCIAFFNVCHAMPIVEHLISTSAPRCFTISAPIITSHSLLNLLSLFSPRLSLRLLLLFMQRELSMTFKRVEAEDDRVTHYADFVEALAIISDLK
jgi:hypothetical protein